MNPAEDHRSNTGTKRGKKKPTNPGADEGVNQQAEGRREG
jgi:hypothetical protein